MARALIRPLTVWAYEVIDWDLIRDDIAGADTSPVVAHRSRETAKAAADKDHRDAWADDPNDPYVPLVWVEGDGGGLVARENQSYPGEDWNGTEWRVYPITVED